MGCMQSVPDEHAPKVSASRRGSTFRESIKRVSSIGFNILNDVLHTQVINDVCSTDLPGEILTASDDKTVQSYNIFTCEKHSYTGHTKGVTRVVFAARTQRIFASGRDGTVCMWNIQRQRPDFQKNAVSGTGADASAAAASPSLEGKVEHVTRTSEPTTPCLRLKGHTLAIQAMALSADERLLATGGRDGSVRVWDTATGTELIHGFVSQNIVTGLAWLPVLESFDTLTTVRWLVQVGEDLTCKLWPVDLVNLGVVCGNSAVPEIGQPLPLLPGAILPATFQPHVSLAGTSSIPHRLVHAPRLTIPTEVEGSTPTLDMAIGVAQRAAQASGASEMPPYSLLKSLRQSLHPSDVFFVSDNGFIGQGCELGMWSSSQLDRFSEISDAAAALKASHSILSASSPGSPAGTNPYRHTEAIRGVAVLEDFRRPEDIDLEKGGDPGSITVASASVDGTAHFWSFGVPPAAPTVTHLCQFKLPIENVFVKDMMEKYSQDHAPESSSAHAPESQPTYATRPTSMRLDRLSGSETATRRLIPTCLTSHFVQRIRPGQVHSVATTASKDQLELIHTVINKCLQWSGVTYFPDLPEGQAYALKPTDSILYAGTQQGSLLAWLVTMDPTTHDRRLAVPLIATAVDPTQI